MGWSRNRVSSAFYKYLCIAFLNSSIASVSPSSTAWVIQCEICSLMISFPSPFNADFVAEICIRTAAQSSSFDDTRQKMHLSVLATVHVFILFSMSQQLHLCFMPEFFRHDPLMLAMDENTSELFRQLAKQVLELPLDEEN